MTEDEYEDYKECFSTLGWKRFVEAYSNVRQALHDSCPNGAVTNDQWQFARGQLAQLDALLGFEQYIEAVWEQENGEIEDDEDII